MSRAKKGVEPPRMSPEAVQEAAITLARLSTVRSEIGRLRDTIDRGVQNSRLELVTTGARTTYFDINPTVALEAMLKQEAGLATALLALGVEAPAWPQPDLPVAAADALAAEESAA